VLTVVGARPQFVKAAPVSRALARAGIHEILVHTGQHYDDAMSGVFLSRLGLGETHRNLGIGSGPHGWQTGRMLEALEEVLLEERPSVVIVYGDTNSTLAGALAASKLRIPVAHVEAGLRSFNRSMPEELNRIVTDHLATLLLAPTAAAVANLRGEGLGARVVQCGDVMLDAARLFAPEVERMAAEGLARFGVETGRFALATVHRVENTDDPKRWAGILQGLERVAREVTPVIWPAHPRTRALLSRRSPAGVQVVDPIPYFETQALLRHARVVLTDSGGLQKEAAFQEIPVVVLRDETEWVELVACGAARLVGTDPVRIAGEAAAATWPVTGLPAGLFGDGHAADVVATGVRDLAMGGQRLLEGKR
jgi:UDP-GlcNAc3NAcA epimerase